MLDRSKIHLEEFKPVLQPPEIIKHPQGRSVIYGNHISLEVAASGSDLKYTWFKDGVEITVDSFQNCYGNRTSRLHIKDFLLEYTGKYMCVVSNSLGQAESRHAELILGNCYI